MYFFTYLVTRYIITKYTFCVLHILISIVFIIQKKTLHFRLVILAPEKHTKRPLLSPGCFMIFFDFKLTFYLQIEKNQVCYSEAKMLLRGEDLKSTRIMHGSHQKWSLAKTLPLTGLLTESSKNHLNQLVFFQFFFRKDSELWL